MMTTVPPGSTGAPKTASGKAPAHPRDQLPMLVMCIDPGSCAQKQSLAPVVSNASGLKCQLTECDAIYEPRVITGLNFAQFCTVNKVAAASISTAGGDFGDIWWPVILVMAPQYKARSDADLMILPTMDTVRGIKIKIHVEGNDSGIECAPGDVLAYPFMPRPEHCDDNVGMGHKRLFRVSKFQLTDRDELVEGYVSYDLLWCIQRYVLVVLHRPLDPPVGFENCARILSGSYANYATESEQHRLIGPFNELLRRAIPTIKRVILVPESDATLRARALAMDVTPGTASLDITVNDIGGNNHLSTQGTAEFCWDDNGQRTRTRMISTLRHGVATGARDLFLRMCYEAGIDTTVFNRDGTEVPFDVSTCILTLHITRFFL